MAEKQEVGLGQPNFQWEVGLAHQDFTTHGKPRQDAETHGKSQTLGTRRVPMFCMNHLKILRSFNIDPSLITALVERWRPETHTFHLPHGECTITLEDVSLQIGVNVNGLPLAGPTYFDWNEICEDYWEKFRVTNKT
ncbi:hypothetical protein Lal_00016585 [Lupinus albus]|nr:hypothetical protein Lal_00016585 [Lupinus albus]